MRTSQDVLQAERLGILEEASSVVARLEHSRRDGELTAHRRLEALYRQVEVAAQQRDLAGIIAHATAIARERFGSGLDRPEVLATISTPESPVRRSTPARPPPAERTRALRLVASTFAPDLGSPDRTQPAPDRTEPPSLTAGAYCDADGRVDPDSVHLV